ncbi:hypothetical protein Daura_31015 [Dactylosporangium aurantiacum]|uniref:LigA protein n=1 Tax=Dactylosporangium aurantiacum TaxID=35754 RepID=A0A9Q9I8N1_9ACTN|nr:hypothetical protein [Dactylosporangium aurantiacum]MDG6107291.1 hypothetical protein [Dactylosporangium aurantiacum]UWZ51181.1 hypothetical protein Daura_31015 [Dactylosporangium aurantiacum]
MHVNRSMTAGLTVAAVLIGAQPAHAGAGAKWTVAPSVPLRFGVVWAELTDVAVRSVEDAWVVGVQADGQRHPIAAHWDGAGWTTADLPVPAGPSGQYGLSTVDTTGPDDVWAAGTDAASAPVFLHGSASGWARVPAAAPAGTVEALDMRSPSDGWAVGRTAQGTGQPFVLRWDGGSWKPVDLPRIAGGLTAVHAVAADDVWAAGSRLQDDGGTGGLLLHWDGTAWTEVGQLPPLPGAGDVAFDDVSAAGHGDVWVVGARCTGEDACTPIALHLGPGGWQVVPSDPVAVRLTGVVAFAADDVWMTGYVSGALDAESVHIEHWDGLRFTTDAPVERDPSDPAGGQGQPASGLSAIGGEPAGRDLWAVGWDLRERMGPYAIHR